MFVFLNLLSGYLLVFFYHFSLVKKDHVNVLRWHAPRSEKDRKQWEKNISRKNFKVSMYTVVCSNHFAAGYYSSSGCNAPTLFMKGYANVPAPSKKRKQPTDRSTAVPTPKAKRSCNIFRYCPVDEQIEELPPQTPSIGDQHYDTLPERQCSARCTVLKQQCLQCESKLKEINRLLLKVHKLEAQVASLSEENKTLGKKVFSVEDLKTNSRLITGYTGLQNYDLFKWLFKRLEAKAKTLKYVNGRLGSAHSRTGPKRKLSLEDEFFLTLVRLRLGLTEMDIGFRFKISQSTVSTILRTWIPFLAKEFEVFIHWPSKEEALNSLPKCFENFKSTIGVIDCTEGAIEKPSMAKAQAQTYSNYKSKNTWKKLLCIVPCGTISFVSKSYGGSASDRFITERCGLLDKVLPGDAIMADKGFNIGDLLVGKGAKLIVPPFLKDKIRFSKRNCKSTSNIAKARIHVERAIARIKDYKILQGAIPITIKNNLDDIFIIICGLTNLAPRLINK